MTGAEDPGHGVDAHREELSGTADRVTLPGRSAEVAAPGETALGTSGTSLESLLTLGRLLPLPAIVQILADIGVELDALHQQGLAYDALSPSAVEVSLDEHAHLVPADEAPPPTPGYRAPEQRHGHLTFQADQYALGVIAWEMITGRRRDTYLDGTHIAVVAELELGPARVLRPGVGPAVNAVIERATNASLEVRYKSAAALVAELTAALGPNPPRQTLLTRASQVDDDLAYRAVLRRRAPNQTGLGRAASWLVGAALAISIVAAAAWLGGNSSARFWRVQPASTKSTGFDWFGWKRKTVVAPTVPAPAAASATGYVSVTVDGASAEVLIDGSVVGRSPVLTPAAPGSHTVQVRGGTQRFEPAAVTIRISGSDTVSAAFRAAP